MMSAEHTLVSKRMQSTTRHHQSLGHLDTRRRAVFHAVVRHGSRATAFLLRRRRDHEVRLQVFVFGRALLGVEMLRVRRRHDEVAKDIERLEHDRDEEQREREPGEHLDVDLALGFVPRRIDDDDFDVRRPAPRRQVVLQPAVPPEPAQRLQRREEAVDARGDAEQLLAIQIAVPRRPLERRRHLEDLRDRRRHRERHRRLGGVLASRAVAVVEQVARVGHERELVVVRLRHEGDPLAARVVEAHLAVRRQRDAGAGVAPVDADVREADVDFGRAVVDVRADPVRVREHGPR
mmetsp:Transcript_19680/g.78319  ORF Transcript_19680/g.78319 Transcript_19680/m.78319 type:complete len:292 (-) Transcript_19680:419-1294(-)